MSASLVGSEMCIRDRPYTGSGPPSTYRTCGIGSARGPSQRWPGVPGAVSYTHLTLPTICSV
eukprot:12369046-Alexandrium_andersonii.AAC.1